MAAATYFQLDASHVGMKSTDKTDKKKICQAFNLNNNSDMAPIFEFLFLIYLLLNALSGCHASK